MAAPQYAMTNYFGTTSPGADILDLIEAQLILTEWVFVEAVTFTQSVSRTMRVWKCPASLNANGTDFYVGFVRNVAGGTYLAVRVFENWDATAKLIQAPVMPGASGTTTALPWSAVASVDDKFVALAQSTNRYAATSTGGIIWAARLLPAQAVWQCVAGSGTIWVALSSSTIAATSTDDGATWTQRVGPPATSIIYANGRFVTINSGTANSSWSTDGITWTTAASMPSAVAWNALAYGAGLFVSVCATAGTIAASSPDGVTWTSRTLPTTSGGIWQSVAYGNGTFVATCLGTTVAATSTNGTTWTARTHVSATALSVVFGDGVFLTVGNAGATQTSPDGITWTAGITSGVTLGTKDGLTYGAGMYVLVATTGALLGVSTNSTNAVAPWVPRGISILSDVALLDYLPTGATTPVMVDTPITFITNTNYDVAVLVSKSYIAIGINTNATGTQVLSWVLGPYEPAYADSPTANPPLMMLSLGGTFNVTTSGVSRSMRAPIDANGFAIGAGPESVLFGSATGATVEPNTQSIRASRVLLVGGSPVGGFSSSGSVRGWLYDAVAVGASSTNSLKIADTVTIGSATYSVLGQNTSATSNTLASNSFCGYFFNFAAGT